MKREKLWIFHHLGIGDCFICNGIVRHYAFITKNITLFYKDPYKEKVKRLYQDLDNISFEDGGIYEDNLAKLWEMTNPGKPLLKCRIERLPEDGTKFDQIFYNQANLPIEYKWSKFYFKRDYKREKEVFYDILGLYANEDFIFLHDDERVETKSIPSDIKIIKPDNQEIDIYDYLFTIEMAKEVHLMNSSFYNLVDCIQLKHNNLFYHEYIRTNVNPTTKLKWKIIK